MPCLPPSERPRSIDEKLARGLVRQEMRGLCPDGLDPTLRRWFQLGLDVIGRPISRFGRGDMIGAAALMRRIEAEAAADPRILRIERRTSGKTLSRRNAYEEIAVCAYRRLSGLDEFGGTSLHILARPRELVLNVRPVPFAFIPHLPERFLNRKREDDEDAWGKAGAVVARGLMDVLPLFCLLARPGVLLPERRLSLPLGSGLALGTVEPSETWDFSGTVREGGMSELPNVNARFLLSPEIRGFWHDRPLIYRGRTYVSGRMLGEDQIRLRTRLLDLRERLRPAEGAYMRLALWPHCVDRDELGEVDDARVALFHRLSEEAAELLSQDWAVRAMGGSEPARGGPLEPDTPIAYSARQLAEEAREGIDLALRAARGMR